MDNENALTLLGFAFIALTAFAAFHWNKPVPHRQVIAIYGDNPSRAECLAIHDSLRTHPAC